MARSHMPQGVRAPSDVRIEVDRLVRRHGFERTARLLGIGREAVLRILGEHPVRRGTVSIVTVRIAELRDDAAAVRSG